MKVAIAYSTKDRPELTQQTVQPVLRDAQARLFDLFWVDGSTLPHGEQLAKKLGNPIATAVDHNVRGGADAAIVFALTKMLAHPKSYTHVGLVENDVLLHDDWFGPTFALFERGAKEGLTVGAVSARCFEDRILIQRDGYAVCHNLGAGHVIFTREAALGLLANYRTGWTLENRRIFAKVSGLDIGKWWAFRGGEHWITADWAYDANLASFGYASLALTPSPVEMIGQTPSLADQGLKLAGQPVELLRNDKAFDLFVERTRTIYDHKLIPDHGTAFHQANDGSWTIFPHQIADIGGQFKGDWTLRWAQGFGPFAYKAGAGGVPASLSAWIAGPCTFLVSGGEKGGRVEVEDTASGYKVSPELAPEGQGGQVMQLTVPAAVSYREVKLTALKPGVVLYGLQTNEQQAWLPNENFDWHRLPVFRET